MEKKDNDRKTILNVPNILTIFRIVLIPVFVYLFLNDLEMWALCVYCLASLTDIADGYIARKYHMITDFGKLVDPLADKLMVIALMVTMVIRGIIPVAILVILSVKEGIMMLGGLYMLKKGIVVYSQIIGKVAQTVVVSGLILCFFHKYFISLGISVHLIVLWCGIALTICALFFYGKKALYQLKNHSK